MNAHDRLIHNVSNEMAERNWTQTDLAREMNRNRSWVNLFLSGHHTPSLSVLDEFAEVFGVGVVSLLK